MRIIITLLGLFAFHGALGQRFDINQNITLSDSIHTAFVDVADFNNDGLLDLLIFATTKNNFKHTFFIKGDTINAPEILDKTFRINDFDSYQLVDYDEDNDIDILLFSSTTHLYRNTGNFLFTKEDINLPPIFKSLFIDLNNDGKSELVGNTSIDGKLHLIFFKEIEENGWVPVGDTLKLDAKSLNAFDANRDGNIDIFVSGRINADSVFTGFLLNNGNYKLSPEKGNPWIGNSSSGDLNGDGVFDICFTGFDYQGNITNRLLISQDEVYSIKDSIPQLLNATTFVADFDADGLADIQMLGKNEHNKLLNLIQTKEIFDTLSANNVTMQIFADMNRDGNLDVIQLIQDTLLHIVTFRNNADANKGPSSPARAWGIPILNRFFLYWDLSVDDKTLIPSLTYDVMLEGKEPIQIAEFDAINERRLKVSHGNSGTQNFKLFDNLTSNPVSYAIQAIDNSFATFSGLCIGSFTNSCTEFESTKIQACSNEQIVLSAPIKSIWFSFTKGQIGYEKDISFLVQKPDTLFYFDPSAVGCAAIKLFIIELVNITKVENYKRYACENQILNFEVKNSWESIEWSSNLYGKLGESNKLDYLVKTSDTLSVLLKNETGCTILRKTSIRISKPELTLDEKEFIILKGQEVQLNVAGGIRWQWLPKENLSNADISNPVAAPLTTTNYTVIGYDSLACTNQTSLKIVVVDTGFVPSLFTPNGDGKNDELKVYGLSSLISIEFLVYNREGKLLFKSSNSQQLIQQGWDGTHNGAPQPTGVYFWKVSGSLASGDKVRLNGKSEGSFVLVR
jgi:gliding motility-associated-like protein